MNFDIIVESVYDASYIIRIILYHYRIIKTYLEDHCGLDPVEPVDYGSPVWIGANDEEVEGNFVWIPSWIPVTVQGWDDGEPDNHGPGEDCVVYYHGIKKWHDVACDNTFEMFVCEGV